MTQIHFVGNTTTDIDIRFTQSGKTVGNVSVAENIKRGDDEKTFFHTVTLWGSLAENARRIGKGTRVVVVGKLEQREWQDTEGRTRKTWEVTADAFGPDARFAEVTATRVRNDSQRQPQSDGSWDVPPADGFADDSSTPF